MEDQDPQAPVSDILAEAVCFSPGLQPPKREHTLWRFVFSMSHISNVLSSTVIQFLHSCERGEGFGITAFLRQVFSDVIVAGPVLTALPEHPSPLCLVPPCKLTPLLPKSCHLTTAQTAETADAMGIIRWESAVPDSFPPSTCFPCSLKLRVQGPFP